MTRRVRPGSIQAAVRAAYSAVGGLENAASDVGASTSTLSYGTEVSEERPGGVGINYLDRLGRIDAAAARPLAEHFASLAAGVFVPLDLGGVTADDINRVTKEFSDVLNAHVAAHAPTSANPDDYTPDEAAAQAKELRELAAVSMRMAAALDAKAGNETSFSRGRAKVVGGGK